MAESTLMAKAEEIEYTPDELKNYEDAKSRRQQAQNSVTGYQTLARWARNDLTADEMKDAQSIGPDVFMGGPGAALFKKYHGQSGLREDWALGELGKYQKNLASAESDIAAIERERRSKRISKKEEVLKGALIQSTTDAEGAIEGQLDKLLEETGIQAGVARGDVGAQLAERGMSRSTMATQAIGDVTAQEFAQKSSQRLQASDLTTQVQQTRDEILRKMDQQKELLEADKADQLESFYNQQLQAAEKGQIEHYYRSLEESAIGSARDKAMMGQTIGGIFQSAGTIALLASDKILKENIVPSDSEILDFLEKLKPKKYTYKDEKYGKGDQYGFLAQDLEKHPVGKSMVVNTPEGKMVDYSRAIAVILAAESLLSKRIKDLEDIIMGVIHGSESH